MRSLWHTALPSRHFCIMEFLRQRIEANVLAISRGPGSADFLQPPGDPGLFGPDSAAWQVHSDFTAMLTGGVAALLALARSPRSVKRAVIGSFSPKLNAAMLDYLDKGQQYLETNDEAGAS